MTEDAPMHTSREEREEDERAISQLRARLDQIRALADLLAEQRYSAALEQLAHLQQFALYAAAQNVADRVNR